MELNKYSLRSKSKKEQEGIITKKNISQVLNKDPDPSLKLRAKSDAGKAKCTKDRRLVGKSDPEENNDKSLKKENGPTKQKKKFTKDVNLPANILEDLSEMESANENSTKEKTPPRSSPKMSSKDKNILDDESTQIQDTNVRSDNGKDEVLEFPSVDEEDEDDDDESPTSISFSDSRKFALNDLQLAKANIRTGKLIQKERRRKRDTFLKEQKIQKLARIEESRLPNSILQELMKVDGDKVVKSDMFTPDSESEDIVPSEDIVRSDVIVPSDGVVPIISHTQLDDVARMDLDDFSNCSYIPLDKESHSIRVTTVKDNRPQCDPKLNALEFRNKHLYSKHIRRQTSIKMIRSWKKLNYVKSSS